MKTLLIATLALFMLVGSVMAGTPTPTAVDTIRVSGAGKLDRFLAYYQLSATTTADTITLPAYTGNYSILCGANATDTVSVSLAQSGYVARFAEKIIGSAQSRSKSLGAPILSRIILKANTTVPVKLWVWW